LIQVSGLSERYEGALEICIVRKPSPKKMPNTRITGSLQDGGGDNFLIIFILFNVFFKKVVI
jgi:hypothetical protein